MNPVLGTAVLLLVALMSTSASAVDPKTKCKGNFKAKVCSEKLGWFRIRNRYCVKPFFDEMTYKEAETKCKGLGGKLASMKSKSQVYKAMCVTYQLSNFRNHYWIGLKREMPQSSKFKWSHGAIFKFSSFAKNQPDNFMGNEECVEMNFSKWGSFNDQNCEAKRPYLCGVSTK